MKPTSTSQESAPAATDQTSAGAALAGGKQERLLGVLHGEQAGPLLIIVAGIHGNEPAGVQAARRVVGRLEPLRARLRGDFIGLLGNMRALARGVRYVDRDLNRGWRSEPLAHPDSSPATSEDLDQRELFRSIESHRRQARGPVYFLDLHTTSADGIPFAMVGDAPRCRDFAVHFPLPLILGLLEQVDAPLLEYMRHQGCVTLGIEAGQHDSARSIEHHEAVLWIALAATGMLRHDSIPDLGAARALLARTRHGLPHVMRVERRHAITPEDRFRMQPGFANIERIHTGQLLARDRRGDIHADRDGVLFMPLYQPLGDDGFFLGRAIHPLRLRLPALLRRWRR